MNESKNALLLFSKPPIPGLVKTRLTKGRGGVLTEEEAAEFFKCCILDITDLAMIAISDLEQLNFSDRFTDPLVPERSYDFFVSTTPQESIDVMRQVFEGEDEWPHPIQYLHDEGSSFDEHFDDAFGQLFSRGYDNVVAIGGDHPTMTRDHIVSAFRWLDHLAALDERGYGFVQAPCQEGGVSIVGQTKATPINSKGVYYNPHGRPVLAAYREALSDGDIPNALLSSVSDVDKDSDLAHAIACVNVMADASFYQTELFVPRRVLEWFDTMGLESTSPPNDEHDPRQYIDV